MPRPPYPLSNISDPHLQRVLQDMVDRQSFLEREVERLGGSIPVGIAKRESPVEGIITIPYRDHGGKDGSVRVSKDGVIVSYTNPVESDFPYVDLRSVGNQGGGTDPLHLYTLKAGTLAFPGDTLLVRYGGTFATNDNDKRIVTSIGGVASSIKGPFDQDQGVWLYDILYSRITPTSVRASVLVMWDQATRDGAGTLTGNFIHDGNTNTPTGIPNMSTTDIAILLSAEGTADNDIVQTYSFIDFYRAKTVRLT